MPRSERHKARRQALQIMYQREVTGEGVSRILDEESYSREEGELEPYARDLALGTEQALPDIDRILGAISEHWTVMRMPLVDRNILRIATFELANSADVPPSVAINEAVELAKVYGGEDSSKFVNGVLGKVAEQYESGS